MDNNSIDHVVVFVTTKDQEESDLIGGALVREKLAACVNRVSDVQSVFWWEGKLDEARENLLVIKTRRQLLSTVVDKVKELHSYSVPEVIAMPIIGGNNDYLEWIDASVKDT